MLHWTVTNVKVGPEPSVDSSDHVAVAVGHEVYFFAGHEVYFFGGYCDMNDTKQMHVHVFNTASLRWMSLPQVTTGSGKRPPDVPHDRWGHTAVLIGYIIYIWGGFNSRGCNHLYAFDVATHRWFKPNISGTLPEARWFHSACVLGTVMYIYGGYNDLAVRSDDLYKLDTTTTMAWSLINTRGTPPPALSRHSATIIGTKMFVFGDQGGFNQDYSIRAFDTETNCWLSAPSSTQLLPQGSKAHSAFNYNGELYIVLNFPWTVRTLNDVWKFNPETLSWKKLEPKGISPIYGPIYRMCCSMVGDHIILFRALTTSDKLYILDFSPSMKTLCKLAVIQYGLEQSGLPHNIRWELASMTTNSNT